MNGADDHGKIVHSHVRIARRCVVVRSKNLELLYKLQAPIGVDSKLLSTQEDVFSAARNISSKERAVRKVRHTSEPMVNRCGGQE